MARKRKAGSQSAGYHSDLSIPGYHPQTPTKAPPPSEAATAPAGNYAGATQEYHHAVAALPPAAQAVTEAASQAATQAHHAAVVAKRAATRQQHLVTKYVTKAYDRKLQRKGVPTLEIGVRIEKAKSQLEKDREKLLSHPAVEKANSEGKVVSAKGLRQIQRSSSQSNAFKIPGGLTHSKEFGIGAAGLAQTPAQRRHLEEIKGVPQGTVGRKSTELAERRHARSEPSTLEDLAYASIGIPGIGIGGDIAKLGELGATAIPKILAEGGAKQLASSAAVKAAAKGASLKALPREIANAVREAPSTLREANQLAKGAAKGAVKAAPKTAARGAERGYQSIGAVGALGGTHKAGLNLPGGAILEGQAKALEHDPGKVLASTANLAPALLVSAFQLPVAAGKSAVEGSSAPLEGALGEQKHFFEHFAKVYGGSNVKAIEKATLEEGLLPEVLAGPFVAKALKKASGSSLAEGAVGKYRARRAPLTDEHGNVITDAHGIPIKRGRQRHPNESRITRTAEDAHLRREEARHAGKTEDLVNVEFGHRVRGIEQAARKAASEKVTVRRGLGPKGKDKLDARAVDFIPFLNRAAIDLRKPDAALREIQHYAEQFKGQKSARELGANPIHLTARDAVDFFTAHPDALKNKHLATTLERYRNMANGKDGLNSLSTSERNRYLGVAVAHDKLLPEERLPHNARPLTDAKTRTGAWEDIKARDKEASALAKQAREKKIEARAVGKNTAKGKKLRQQYKGLYAKAKTIRDGRDALYTELKDYTRPGAKPNRNAKRTAYDEALEKEFAQEVRDLAKERGLHPEPAYVPDTSAVARANPDQSATGGQKALPPSPQINEGYVFKHGLQVQGYEHLMNGVLRSVAAHHWFENGRRFRTENAIDYKGSVRHDSKEWAQAFQHGVISERDVVLVPTQVLNRLERSVQEGTPSDYATASAEMTGAAVKATGAVPGTKYEAYPRAAYEEFAAQAQKAPVSHILRTANMATGRTMLSTPSFVGSQVVAETAQGVAEANPPRLLQGLYNYSKLSAEDKAKISGVSGETGKAIFSPDRLGNALAHEGKPMKDALSFFRRNLFGRTVKDIVTMKWAGDVNRVTSGLTRRAVLTGAVMRDLNGLQRHGRGLLGVQTELQKEIGHLSGKEQLAYVANHPQVLDAYHKKLGDAMGLWNNLTRTGHFPEVYRAAGLIFYPFLRMSVLWPLKYAVNHPIKATALAYLAAQNNFALREALQGEPSFLNYAQIPLYGRDPKTGKLEATNTINLSRMSPGGNAIVSAIQGTQSPLGAVQPVIGAAITGATGQGPLGPIEGGPLDYVKAAGASLLSLSPYLRALDTARGQKASGQTEMGILAKRANIAIEPLQALEAKLKGSIPSQLVRSLANPLKPYDIKLQRDQSKLSRVMKTLSDNSSEKRNAILGATAKEQRKIASMEKKSEKAHEELQALYKKYGLDKAAKLDEKIWMAAHPFGGWNQKESNPYEGSGYEGGGYEPEGYGEKSGPKFKNFNLPHETNGVSLPGLSLPGLGSVTGTISSLIGGTPAQAAGLPAKGRSPRDALGKKTVGNPTRQELIEAGKAGKLTVNHRGKILTPAVRRASKELRKAYSHAVPKIEGFSDSDQQQFAQWLSHYTKIPPKLAGEWVKQEGGGWGSHGVSGGQAGEQNWLGVGYPAHTTPFSESPYFNNTTPQKAAKATAEWMEGKIGHNYGYGAAPSIQRISQMAKEGQPEAAIRSYIEGPSQWGTGAISQSGIVVRGVAGGAQKALRIAKRNAKKVGLNPTAFNGDVEAGPGKTVTVRADAKGMVNWAKSAVGTPEGSPRQLHYNAKAGISASEPWCAAFIATGLERRGVVPPSDPAYSGSYLDPSWKGGTQIGTDLRRAKPGDLVVYGSSEHIALYVGSGEVIAGNYGNEVARYNSSEDSRGIQGIVRPHYRGGKIQIHESAALPGSTAEEAFAGAPPGAGSLPGVEGTSTAATAGTTKNGKREKVHGRTAGQRLNQVNAILSGDLTKFGIPTATKGPSVSALAALGRSLESQQSALRSL